MNHNIEIDTSDFIGDTIKEILQTMVGIAIITAFTVLLVAPMVAPLIEAEIFKKYDVPNHPLRMQNVNNTMIKVKVVLWTIAIFAWSSVTLAYIFH